MKVWEERDKKLFGAREKLIPLGLGLAFLIPGRGNRVRERRREALDGPADATGPRRPQGLGRGKIDGESKWLTGLP